MADQDELSGVTLDMSKSQPLPSAPENDFSGVKLDLSKSTPISGSAIAPKPMSAQEEHDRYSLTHPEAGQLPSGAAMPADHTIRDTPSSYAQAALTRTPSTSATNIPAMRPEDIKTAQSIAPTAGAKVGREIAATGIANMRGPSYAPSDVNATATPQENTEQFRKEHPTATGVAEGVGGFVGGQVADPVNWALAATGTEVFPILSKVAAAAFSAKMSKDTLDGIENLRANWGSMSEEERAETITTLGLGAIFAEEAGRHALNGVVTPGSTFANKFAGRDTAGEPALPTAAAAVRLAGRAADKVIPAAPYIAGAAVGHPYVGARLLHGITDPLSELADRAKVYGLSPEDKIYAPLEERARKSEAETAKAKAAVDNYKYSADKRIAPPKDVTNAYEKAKERSDEDRFHADTAKEASDKAYAAKQITKPAPNAETTPEPEITAKPVAPSPLAKLGEKPPINVKTPGQVQPETFPQEPTEAPKAGYRTMQLPGGEPVGKQALLTEGTPEGSQAPKGGLPKINIPEEKPAVAPKPERGNLRDLKVDNTGKVVEKDAEGERLHQLLIESLKNTKGNENFPAATVEKPAAKVEEAPKNYNATKDQWGTREKMAYDAAMEKRAAEGGKTRIEGTQNRRQAEAPVAEERRTGERRNAAGLRVDAEGNPTLSPDVEGHWQAGAFGEKPVEDSGAKAREANPEPTRAETKPVLPKEEPTGYAAKKEEVVPAGSEGREPATPAAEYHPEVRQRVFELGNEDLKALARAHGLNPDAPEYAFGKGVKRTEATATSSGRQQTGRAKLADDVTAQMSDDEKINIGRNARTMESEGTFKGQDVSNTSRAEQARKLFPRLNAEETTGGYGSKNTGVTKEAKDAALKSFNDKATRSNAGFDPSMLKDAAKVAAYHIEAGARSFADFSTKMVEDFGEGIRPYLKDLHTKASEEALGKETAKTSAKDTDHMQAAIKELGPDAKLSDITKRAQEMKDSHAQVAAHNENGGSTFHPTKGDLNGKPAFSVGGEPEFKSPGLKMTTDGKELTTAQRDEFANRHAVKEALDKHKDASIGTWYDKETDKTTTELVKTPTDRAEAIAMGQKNGEKAIYDLGKGEEIKTGGTGEGPATLEAHHWSNTPDLTETDPEKMGTGVRGAERARMNEPGFQKRTNFGTEGYKEPAVQGQKYHYVSDLEASKYYDVQKDADGIWQKGFEEGGATGAEKAVRDAGYHGYRSGNEVASFEKVPVRPHVEAKPEFSMVTDADGKPDRLEITHNGEPVGHLKIEEQVPGTWTIKDAAVKADAQGQGFGKAAHMQAFEEARRAGAKTVESDVSNSSKENGVWESLKRDYPEAITEENGQYSADLSKISEKPQSIGAASAAAMGADKSLNRRPNGTVIESTAAKKLTVHSPAGKSFGDDEHEASFTYGEGGEYKNKAAAMEAAKDMSKVELEDDPKWEGVRGITDEKTATTAKEAKEASQAAAQNVRDEEATKKNKVEIQKLQESLPELAQEHLTQQEKDGITTTATGKPRTVGTAKFLANLAKNTVQYAKDIAMQGAGARKWYSRSTGAFEAIEAEAPNYFKKGDRNTLINFLGSLAGDSPQQAVVSNLRETLSFWKEWVDAGRPDLSLDKWKKFGDIADAAWKEDGSPRVGGREKGASMHWDYAPKGDEWNTENLLLRNLTLPETKVPNMIKAINGEPMWPDLTKNAAFKVPSFRENLIKWLGGKSSGTKHVTNDSWQGLWGDVKKKDLTNPESYHPLSVITRAAAKELGWEPEEAQAAIWSFTQCLTEKGSEDPEVVRHYSEDYADLVGKDGDDEVRSLLEKLGVNHGDLDKRLARLEQKPEIDKNTSRGTPTTADSVRQLRSRIETARGKGAIPEPKSIQGSLFRENPAFEHKSNPGAGHTRTGPTELELIKAEEQAKADKLKAEGELNSPLKKLGSKETPYKDKDTLFNPEEFENESNLGKLGEKKKKSPYGKL